MITLKKGDEYVEIPQGFSWTTLLFGFFVPLIRGDFVWAIVMVLCAISSFGISLAVFPFFYNKIFEKKKRREGFK